jgi:hypothetical protein
VPKTVRQLLSRLAAALLWSLLVLGPSCGVEAEEDGDVAGGNRDTIEEVLPAAVECSGGASVALWQEGPGEALLLLTPSSVPGSQLTLEDASGEAVPRALATAFRPRGGLVFLVTGTGFPAWTDADLAAFEGALLAASPGLHLGLASACDGPAQLLSLDAVARGARLTSGLAPRLSGTCVEPDLTGALAAAARKLADLQPREPLLRLLVLAGNPADREAGGQLPAGVQLLFVDASVPALQAPEALAGAVTEAASGGLDRFAALGLCGDLPLGSILASSAGWRCVFGEAHAGGASEACDAEALARFPRQPPALVDLRFTEEQRLLYDQLYVDKAKDEFLVSVEFDGGPPVAASARFHGQTTMDCVRKSYSLNLKGARVALPEGGLDDEFFLISMCGDDRYFRQYSAALLARELGLFQDPLGYVELRLDGQTAGPYLLVGKTHEILKKGVSGLTSVIRRRFDPEDQAPEVKFSLGTPAQALADYRDMVAAGEGLAGQALAARVDQVLDLRAFLRMVALFSVLRVGDWIDETMFYAEDFAANSLAPWGRFRPHAWDLDDCNESCHHSGKHALVDPFGLAFCAEGDLEKLLLVDPFVYGLFVEELEALLDGPLAPPRIAQAVAAAGEDLLPYFDRPEVCAVMNELLKKNPEATDPAVARADLEQTMQAYVEAMGRRNTLLKEGIAAWRAAQEAR